MDPVSLVARCETGCPAGRVPAIPVPAIPALVMPAGVMQPAELAVTLRATAAAAVETATEPAERVPEADGGFWVADCLPPAAAATAAVPAGQVVPVAASKTVAGHSATE